MTAPALSDRLVGAMATPVGEFELRPVLPADLLLVTAWMNDPVVAEFWDLDGPAERTERHIRAQLDGGSLSLLGLLDGAPMSYWELYRADLDPLAEHYPAQPQDIGVHLLLGPPEARGRGLGSALLAALAERVLARLPDCHRVVAEPDVRNSPSVRAFERAGFRRVGELQLPDKNAFLMMCQRDLS